MNLEKTKKPIPQKIFEGISKVPIWAWMIILGLTSAFSSVYQTTLVVNSYVSIYELIPTKTFFAIMLVIVAVVFPFLIRLFARIDYAIASRLYFRRTHFVPDYNLRKLPVPYNDFLRVALFLYAVINLVKGCLGIVVLAFPFTIYIMRLPEFLVQIATFVFGVFMLKPFAQAWQYKNFFFSLGLPTALLLALSVLVGV